MITRGTVDGHQLKNTPVLLSTGDTEMDVTAKMCLFSTPGQIANQRKSASATILPSHQGSALTDSLSSQ